MTPAQATAGLIALAVVLACGRLAGRGWRTAAVPQDGATGGRALPWLLLLVALQPVGGWLLWRALFPPARGTDTPVLVVATAATPMVAVRALPPGARLVALPEAPALPGATRVPDLATALRAQPARSLQVLGRGLPARDQAAAHGLPLRFDPVPLPRGLVGLQYDAQPTVGLPFQVTGDVAGLAGGRVELRDPGDAVVATAPLPSDGRFALQARAPVTGRLEYQLVLVDARVRRIDSTPLALDVIAGATPRILLLAGGPGPEWKYLRRWATDAGLPLQARLPLGAGVDLRDPGLRLDVATLRASDVLALDARAWRALDGGTRAGLRAAVDAGLGLLLVLDAPPGADERAALRGFGIVLAPDRAPDRVVLPASLTDDGPAATAAASVAPGDEASSAREEAEALADATAPTRQALRAEGEGVQALLHDADGRPLGAWRARGRGRVGVLWLGDTYRLVLAGHAATHARLWSSTLGELARARRAPPPRLRTANPRVGSRAVLCADDALRLEGPGGEPIALVARRGVQGQCAAFWPARAGLHRARGADGGLLQFDVLAADALPGLRARADGDATRALAASAPDRAEAKADSAATSTPAFAATADADPRARWPWALAWLLAAAAGWALERRVLRAAPGREDPAGRPVAPG